MTNKNKLDKFVKHSHRGIAGIIVSLILIAVAVVGGISVFMFTQGFISDTSVSAPTIDVVEIFGYDTSDALSLTTHTGAAILINSNAVAATLEDSDAFALYVRNRGSGVVVVDSIEVFGTVYTISTTGTCVADSVPADGEFSISTATDTVLTACGSTSLASGEEVTVYVRYDDGTNGNVALGRPIPVTVVTANGMEISKQLTNGAQVG